MSVKIFANSTTRSLIKTLITNVTGTKYNTSFNPRRTFALSGTRQMRYVQFKLNGGPVRLGAQVSADGDIFDISAVDPSIPNTLIKFINSDKTIHEKAKRIIGAGSSVHSCKDVTFLPPILHPDKVACVGLNYKGHCDEQSKPYPTNPMIFSKFSSVLNGPYADVVLPQVSDKVDWEVELVVVIGKTGRNIPIAQAYDHVFGYTVAQDISARDWQKSRNGGQFLLGKTMDTFCPLGPAVVTKDCVPDPHNLKITCSINDVLKQSGNTNELIFKVDFLISYLSQIVTLYPGDLILTGTPGGVGMYRNPPEYLKKGDVIVSSVEGVGCLRNNVV